MTQQTGRITVVGVTSGANPESRRLWRSLMGMNSIRELSGSVSFVELDMQADPASASSA